MSTASDGTGDGPCPRDGGRTRRVLIGTIVVLGLLVFALLERVEAYTKTEDMYVYLPDSGVLYRLEADPSPPLSVFEVLNPFRSVAHPSIGLLEYRGSLEGIEQSIRRYEELDVHDHDEAFGYLLANTVIDLDHFGEWGYFRPNREYQGKVFLPAQFDTLAADGAAMDDVQMAYGYRRRRHDRRRSTGTQVGRHLSGQGRRAVGRTGVCRLR